MDNTIVKVFENQKFGNLRVVTDEKTGNPLFCAKDVALALGYRNTKDAISKHCKGVAIRYPLSTSGGTQTVRFITEGDMYRLIASSKLEGAQRFESWVFDEVLPSIRRDGGYMVSREDESPEETMARAILIAQSTIERQKKRIAEMRPKEIFADAVSASHTSILVGELAKLLSQNGYPTGQNRLFAQLREEGYLMKGGSSKNMPTQKSRELGLIEIKETTITNPDGTIRVTKTPKVTGKGQVYFINRYCGKES